MRRSEKLVFAKIHCSLAKELDEATRKVTHGIEAIKRERLRGRTRYSILIQRRQIVPVSNVLINQATLTLRLEHHERIIVDQLGVKRCLSYVLDVRAFVRRDDVVVYGG